jgi:hypothetical protein
LLTSTKLCAAGLPGDTTALRQRWQQAGAPPALITARGSCLTLHIRPSSIQGPDLAALGVKAVVAASSGASLHVEGLRCGGLSEVACVNATGVGAVRLEGLDVTRVTLKRGSAVQVGHGAALWCVLLSHQASSRGALTAGASKLRLLHRWHRLRQL